MPLIYIYIYIFGVPFILLSLSTHFAQYLSIAKITYFPLKKSPYHLTQEATFKDYQSYKLIKII